jgi:hypothetical protein
MEEKIKNYSKFKLYGFFIICVLLFIISNQRNFGQKIASVPYSWKSVQIVGGGFVDGIVFHPTAKGYGRCLPEKSSDA